MILYQCDICGEKDLAENVDFVHIGDAILCKDCYKKITVDSTLDDVLEIIDTAQTYKMYPGEEDTYIDKSVLREAVEALRGEQE